ncbi:MAG: tetratricopeptide repeat protein, partial [Anaerolineaceae bacterium]
DFNQAIEIKPDYDQSYYDRALTYVDLGNLKAAASDLEFFLTLTDDDKLREQAQEHLAELQGR